MKPYKEKVEVLERGTQLRTAKLSIDEENLDLVMEMLATLYTYPAEAIVREYATNAWDSHVEAGNPNPIEVTTPNRWDRKLYIQDYGVGLSVDELYDLYRNYGSSTKRESDDVTGMLGIGSKSGLSYADSFNIRAVKDGRYAEILVARDADSARSDMKLLDEGDTDEPNGVRFSIEVSDVNEIKRACDKVFKYWKHAKVLIDGQPPKLVAEGEKIDDKTFLLERTNTWGTDANDIIVMGNVAYPVDFELRSILRDSKQVIHWADIGAFTPHPSREALKYNKHTKQYIESVKAGLQSNILPPLQAEVDKADNIIEGFLSARKIVNDVSLLNWRGLEWNDFTAPKYVQQTVRIGYDETTIQEDHSNRQLETKLLTGYGVVNKNVCIVTNFDVKKFTKSHAVKLRKHTNKRFDRVFLFDGKDFDKSYLAGLPVYDYNDFKDIKVEVYTQYGKVKTAGRYYQWDAFQKTWVLQETDPKGKYIYFSSAKTEGYKDRYRNVEMLKNLFPDYTPVKMTANRFKKFERDHKNAIHSHNAVMKMRDEVDAQLTHADKLRLAGRKPLIDDKSKILDPELVKYIEEFDGWDADRIAKTSALVNLGVPVKAVVDRYDVTTKYDFRKNYPALEALNRPQRIEYVNAMYTYRQEKK